ncbi:NACHT, LRR and PYD domains-containing protein 7-like [Hydra vulgaris]|uniref:NACHT, LRR and PYD domains-containing protein 7-like n=1 Tax=Hydra vulgaris TaxID=6087 RepID=A0ABM4BBD1_HYDVU
MIRINIKMAQNNTYAKKCENILYSQEFMLSFSECVGVSWKTLGRRLNIEEHYLSMIDEDNPKTDEKAYSMLTTWMQTSDNPTFEELKTALRNMKRIDLLRKIDKFTKTPGSPEITSRFSANKDTSEMCTALKNYYREKYGKINEVQPPLKVPANVDLMDNFVDLCIVDAVNTQMDFVFNFERKFFLEKQMNYTPIPYNEIFMKEKSVILISGVAGIGKTWLLRKCLLDWANDLIWKNVKLVFYLECRRLNQYPNISNLNELLNVFYKDIINDFKISNHPALFIIDGLDEFKFLNELINPSSSCKYPIVNALIEIQNYKYVVAGRVYAIDQYQSISIEHSDKLNIQIMGFNQIGIHNYIENKVREEKKDVVKETLNSSPIAKAMASVPFYLCSMCKIISNSKEINKNSFLTMTNLYASIFLYFFQNHIIKMKKLMNKIIEDDSNKKYILNICKIAYELFVENKVVFSEEEIQTFIIDFDNNESNLFGFIEKIETNLECYYQFAHLTIMEFCASVYAYNCLSIEEIIANRKLESCLSMICGLTNKSQNSLIKFLVNLNPSKSGSEELLYSILDRLLKSKTYYDNLFIECFYESQSSFNDKIKFIVDEGKRWWKISIHDRKTSYETSCENYFVNHYINSGRKLSLLNIDKNILSDEEKNLIIQCSTNVREVKFRCPIKFEGWKPKDRIKILSINALRDLITKKDFEENFLPWINLCEVLDLCEGNKFTCLYKFSLFDLSSKKAFDLYEDYEYNDFIEEICEWIRCSNVKKLWIKYRGKHFYNLDELKNFLTQKNI